ncbi:MAG TPA: hypothetical protein VM537_16520, partial [Anaerolineae bacterium]|nr:hypothetical protein [Anaerolineae bacterium]
LHEITERWPETMTAIMTQGPWKRGGSRLAAWPRAEDDHPWRAGVTTATVLALQLLDKELRFIADKKTNPYRVAGLTHIISSCMTHPGIYKERRRYVKDNLALCRLVGTLDALRKYHNDWNRQHPEDNDHGLR